MKTIIENNCRLKRGLTLVIANTLAYLFIYLLCIDIDNDQVWLKIMYWPVLFWDRNIYEDPSRLTHIIIFIMLFMIFLTYTSIHYINYGGIIYFLLVLVVSMIWFIGGATVIIGGA